MGNLNCFLEMQGIAHSCSKPWNYTAKVCTSDIYLLRLALEFYLMNVEQLLQLIPEGHLDFLSTETEVDYQVKKLSGSIIFKLILFSMLDSPKVTLRIMETILQSAKFKQFAQSEPVNAKYNSIRDRICNINCEFFRRLFEDIFEIYNKELKEEKALVKADST